MTSDSRIPKPGWLRKPLPSGGRYEQVKSLISGCRLHTVCQEAGCPNMFECFSKNTATFMILGATCTRNCRFCQIGHGMPEPVDPKEPGRVALAAKDLQLRYVVITSVTRDDLLDGGSRHFAHTIAALKKLVPAPGVEVLIPDFKADVDALHHVVQAGADVINHNIETVAALYPMVRPQAVFIRSLDLMKTIKQIKNNLPVKSGIMVGLGETTDDLEITFKQMVDHGCDMLTIGQYLRPSRNHLAVQKYYSPEEFLQLEQMARNAGFQKVATGPFVRSSYRARELFES